MRVLLVPANRERIPDPVFPLGLAYVAASAREAGHRVAVADLCFGRTPLEGLIRRIEDFRPEIVGLSMRNVDNAAYPLTVDYLGLHREVVAAVRAATPAPVVLGGSGFSVLPAAYMKSLDGDWGITGEGEVSFVDLLAALQAGRSPRGVAGLLRREKEDPAHVPEAPAAPFRPRDWGAGPRPARDLFDYPRYVRRGGTGNVQTKRGCVFR